MIPNFAVIGVQTPEWHMPRLWIPLFLLWIPVILLSPLILVVLLVVCLSMRISFWDSISVFWSILYSLPGTNVHVRADGTQVQVRVI